jgi:hypothetical protein
MNNDKKCQHSRISTKTPTGHEPDMNRTRDRVSRAESLVVSGRPESDRCKSFIYVATGHYTNKGLRTRQRK